MLWFLLIAVAYVLAALYIIGLWNDGFAVTPRRLVWAIIAGWAIIPAWILWRIWVMLVTFVMWLFNM